MTSEPLADFEGRKVVVTGASSGIGRAIAVALSHHGAFVVLVGRNETRLDETAGMLADTGFERLVLDLRHLDEIAPRMNALRDKVGRIYGLCHAAGVVDTRPLQSLKPSHLRAMLEVNLLAGTEIARTICRRDVMEEGGGSVLFISSVYSLIGVPGEVGYSATKGAVAAAARSMAIELARRKIRVNVLSPGFVRTEMTDAALSLIPPERARDIEALHPLGTGTPADVARAAVFVLAPQNQWMTGTDLVIDGGYTAH